MIIHGGEPPHIENPDPRFGKVIDKLNDLTYAVQENINNFNISTKEKLQGFTQNLGAFVTEALLPIDAHIAAKGAQHGEHKGTVGLGKKDNYRMATLAEMLALTPVSAYVSPQGAKQSIVQNSNAFVKDNYQLNDAFQMASYYVPDEYPVGVPTVVQPPRYFSGGSLLTPVLVNGDRVVLSPVSQNAQYQKQSIFVSGPTVTAGGSEFAEVQNLNTRYLGNNWNAVGGLTAEGKIAIFRPLADRKIYEFKNSLGMSGGNFNLQLFRGYASVTYKGLAVNTSVNGLVITLNHKFFRADLVATDPTVVEQLTSSYQALFTQIGKTPYTGPANGSHSYNVADFVNLAPGQTLEVGGNNGVGPVTSLFWNAQDYELYLFVVVPLILRSGGAIRYLNLTFVESIIPGSLATGGSAAFRQLGTLTKDTINADMTIASGAKWLALSDRWDFFNPALLPGAVLPTGEVVKAAVTKYGIRVKRGDSAFKGIREWVLGARPAYPIKEARTEVYAPSRHSPFRAIPDRILPIAHDAASTTYLSYALNRETGRYEWTELRWNSTSPISTEASNKFGVRVSDVEAPVDLYNLPRSLSTYVSKTVAGVSTNALVFTTENGYKGRASISYANRTLTLGAVVSLSQGSLVTLQAGASRVMRAAAAANPTVNAELREAQIQVYAVTANRALVVISDGLCYAEAAVVGYTVSGGNFSLNFSPSLGFVTKPVTPGGQTVSGSYRSSWSGDDVWIDGSDLLAVQVSADSWQVAISRPFGNLYGDLSFTVGNFTQAQATFTPGKVNPARLYTGGNHFDLVDELHPPLLVPNKGVYQYAPTNGAYSTLLTEVGGVGSVDPYDINETGWVNIPAGSKVMIRGRAYILDREFPVKTNATGTTYVYLVRNGDTLTAVTSSIVRETANNEVLIGTAANGIFTINHSYLVMDNHVVSPTRRGSAIPVFDDNGGNGVNQFFTRRDVT